MRLEYYTNVKEGKMQRNTALQIANDVKHFEGKRIHITIEKLKSKRSTQQNRYLHALFTIFKDALNDLGNDFRMEEVKELCKAKFALIDVVNKDSGECLGQRIKGTHEMSKSEMMDFIESIIRWGAEFQIILPYPSEIIKINFD